VRLLCNLLGVTERTYGNPQSELSMFRPRFEMIFIACTGMINTFNARYVSLLRANSPVCYRSAVELNVAKASTNSGFFFIRFGRIMRRHIIFGNFQLLFKGFNFTQHHVISDDKQTLKLLPCFKHSAVLKSVVKLS